MTELGSLSNESGVNKGNRTLLMFGDNRKDAFSSNSNSKMTKNIRKNKDPYALFDQDYSEFRDSTKKSIQQRLKIFGSGPKGLFNEKFVFINQNLPGPSDYAPVLPKIRTGPVYKEITQSIIVNTIDPGPGHYNVCSNSVILNNDILHSNSSSRIIKNSNVKSKRNRTVPALHINQNNNVKSFTLHKEANLINQKTKIFQKQISFPNNNSNHIEIPSEKNKIDLDSFLSEISYDPFQRYFSIRADRSRMIDKITNKIKAQQDRITVMIKKNTHKSIDSKILI